MSLGFLSAVSEHVSLQGRGAFYGLSAEKRYSKISRSDLEAVGLFQKISSATVWPSQADDATVIFFEQFNYAGVLWGPEYSGRFLQITNPRSSGTMSTLSRFADHGFDNKTASILLVDSRSSLRFSFRDLVLEKWRSIIDARLAGSQVRREGEPVLTWEMFPKSTSFLSPDRIYLKIHQRLHVSIEDWADYAASLTYHIRLFIDGDRRFRGQVDRWALWVESGIISSDVADALEPQAIAGMDALNAELDTELDQYSSFSFSDVFYLPGRQLSSPSPPILTGHTTDDITIVLVPVQR